MSKGSLSPGQDVVLDAFVATLRRTHPGLNIDGCPDKLNRKTSDIDAIAGPYAIEHTSVDTIANQRKNNASFLDLFPDPPKLKRPIEFSAIIGLPWYGVENAADRPTIKTALSRYLQDNLSILPLGHHRVTPQGVPFEITISKRKDSTPSLHIVRYADPDPTLPSRLAELIERKGEKLAPYKEAGKITILLLETEDLALMNQGIMLAAIRKGFGSHAIPVSVDQIWYADATIPRALRFVELTGALANT